VRRLIWTEPAKEDLTRIRRELTQLSPLGAKRIGARVVELVRHLRRNPEQGPMGRIPGIRELVITNTELIVLYVVKDEDVFILGVVSGRQDRG